MKDALSDFDRFKEEMAQTHDPKTISNDLVRSVQSITKQGCQALRLLNTFGAVFAIPSDVKERTSKILHYFLHDPEGVRKLALLSEEKNWDFAKNFMKLDEIVKKLP